ncbi:MAG: LamG domain-containing protein, partial [Planctomycetota bacterium]
WTTSGVKMLTLWFRGTAGNDANEQMYVGLEDSDGISSYSQVNYGAGDNEDMNDIRVEEWQEWNIPLNSFTNVDLEDVNDLYIGFGERFGGEPGGLGIVYFDDIRLYQPTCVLWERPSEFVKYDLYADCVVDFDDVRVMSEEWLKADVNLGAVTKPDDANLLGWWKLDDGGGGTAIDSSTYNHHGDIETIDVNVWWVTGRNDVNYALDFDGGRVRVADTAALRPLDEVSAAAWIKYSGSQNSARVVVKGADNKETYTLEVDEDDDLVFRVRDGNDPNAGTYPDYGVETDDHELSRDEWIHVAGTLDGNDVKCYVNGELKATTAASALFFLSQDTNDLAIGNRSDASNRPLVGTIDDVRVYDYGLSQEEVRYLATDGTGILAVQSIANLVYDEALGQGAVNLRDFAELAAQWLEEELYPQ